MTCVCSLAEIEGTGRVPPRESKPKPQASRALQPAVREATGAERTLEANEFLFRAGDPKLHVYRVESGAICVYEPLWNGHKAVIDFAFPGDLVGLGFLQDHPSNARALRETRVTCLPLDAAREIVAGDPKAEAQLADSIDREFDARREQLREQGKICAMERVASLLVTLSANNAREGRRADLINDAVRCGHVADMLDMNVDSLAEILLELARRGLVEAAADGALRIKDIDALEAVADGFGEGCGPDTDAARPPKLPGAFESALV